MTSSADADSYHSSAAIEAPATVGHPFFHHTNNAAADSANDNPLSGMVQSYLFDSAVCAGRRRERLPTPQGAFGNEPGDLTLSSVEGAAVGQGNVPTRPLSATFLETAPARHGSRSIPSTRTSQLRLAANGCAPSSSSRRTRCLAHSGRSERSRIGISTATEESHRYRRIEDLACFVRTGIINDDTYYFLDPMQRRLEAEKLPPLREETIAEDPRIVYAQAGADAAAPSKSDNIVPRGAQCTMRKFNLTTGLVKPYAMGRGHTVKMGQVVDHTTMENAMDAYVAQMQSQRPSKGLSSYYH